MKHLPEIKNSCADIYNHVKADVKGSIIICALRWKIFDFLEQPVSAETVAQQLNFHPRNTELFLNVLAGMDIICKKNGQFFNSKRSAEFLVSNRSGYLGSFFLFVHGWFERFESNLETLVKNGPPEDTPMNVADGSIWAESARASAAYQYAGPVRYIVETVRSLPEFPRMKKMLDLGGGSGGFTLGIVSAHPNMKGIVFEQPVVAAVTREFIQQFEAVDRVSVREGNYMTDEIGSGYDLIFASATLNFAKDNLAPLFNKVYDALNPGGVFITHQDGITAERTKPVCHVSEFLAAELYGSDFAIPQGLIADTMLSVGFRSVRSTTKQSDFGDMDIDIGRKVE